MARDSGIDAHRQWLGYVQPSGLVVSIPALLEANARLDQNYAPNHRRFLSALPAGPDGEPVPEILNFPAFAETVFEWRPEDLYGAPGGSPLPENLEIALPDYHETLRPTYALRDFEPAGGNGDSARPPGSEWILLVQVLARGTDFDKVATSDDRHWQATPQAKFERLLRQAHVPIGLLVNDRQIRLVYAPEKELSGHITFNLADMVTVAGRPILSALLMLLHETRLFSMGRNERLPAILENSRKYQNTVSTQLATQVVEALYELLRGFQAADDAWQNELLKDVLARDPEEVYRGLLTTLLRLVFVLYAEDRALLSSDELYEKNYSLGGLYARLREDDGRYHDTMDRRYGAWAQLLVLFRLIHSGARHEAMQIPAREGYLFDPERYRFLEGRVHKRDKVRIPRVSDGVIFNVLTKLRVLDGERLSYRTLAVEQIGSVYQAIMGFGLELAKGRSIAIKPAKKHGAPATINLEELLRTVGEKRANWFKEQTDQKLTGKAADDLKQAATIEELLMALDKAKKIAVEVTPGPVPEGAMIFQPSDERRKSGSHYTPSSLTGPIVEAALEPVLKQLGENPTPAQILNLKICDLAMGSAAFLVEACRQLGDALVRAWHAHNEVPQIPLDEDEALFAQRLVAQRCLYGLDKNQMAADLAKLSLWLATLAKDHPFTFLDHSLRHGDALVGLTRRQIAAFHWETSEQKSFIEQLIGKSIAAATEHRTRILNARENTPYAQLQQELNVVEDALNLPRMVGDAVIAAFFSAEKSKQREEARKKYEELVRQELEHSRMITVGGEIDKAVTELRTGEKPTPPFHWELEFPEVFTADKAGNVTGGFDVVVGNPPYGGKNTLIGANREGFVDWLKTVHVQSHGNADLVAHFFRRAFNLLRVNGCFGLIATNTIRQGDTRSTGLRWICTNGGTIYRATRRLKWPGEAAVMVSVIHVMKGLFNGLKLLDSEHVPLITAYLFYSGGNQDPATLQSNKNKSFIGSYVLGMGFTFDDEGRDAATPLDEMHRLMKLNPKNAECIFPYLGGEELNESPTQQHRRFVINFKDWPLKRENLSSSWRSSSEEVRKQWQHKGVVPLDYPGPVAADYPELLDIVTEKVRPERLKQGRESRARYWWRFGETTPALFRALSEIDRAFCCAQTSKHFGLVSSLPNKVFSHKIVVFALTKDWQFAIMQSRVHGVWIQFFGSTLEDRPVYTPSDCFETFPFPTGLDFQAKLDDLGRRYYDHRATLMQAEGFGLTTLYNLFHDRECELPGIHALRQLHDSMDRAVLDAYGWSNIKPRCDFFPEFEEEEQEDESGRPKRKEYRYRWPDEVRDEVLARLLELNRQRAKEEGQIVVEENAPIKKRAKKAAAEGTLFDGQ